VKGEQVDQDSRRFTVLATERNRIARVRIEKIEPATEPPGK
jgi:CBS domain containing-hemolysin-like protein